MNWQLASFYVIFCWPRCSLDLHSQFGTFYNRMCPLRLSVELLVEHDPAIFVPPLLDGCCTEAVVGVLCPPVFCYE